MSENLRALYLLNLRVITNKKPSIQRVFRRLHPLSYCYSLVFRW